MSQSARYQWTIGLAAALVFFTNLGGPKLWDADEPRNATCAREMLARGDVIVPTFNGEVRTDKPVLLYWLIMGAYQVFGDNEFAARFFSALAAVGTVLCTYHLGRILFRPEVGLWAAIGLATSLWFGFTGRAATPDALLILCSTFALMWFAKSSFPGPLERTAGSGSGWSGLLPRRWLDFALIYAAMGLGLLAKGPVGVVLPAAVIGVYLLWVRELPTVCAPVVNSWWSLYDRAFIFWRSMLAPSRLCQLAWALRPVTAVGVIGAIALPWYVAVGWKTNGAWLVGFFGKPNWEHAGAAAEHGGSVFHYVPTILAGFFPWSIFLPLSLWRPAQKIFLGDPQRRKYIFLAVWIGLYATFFTLAGTKLPSYVLPAYPALAILVGVFLEQWFARPGAEKKFWMRTAFVALAVTGAVGLVGLPLASSTLLPGERSIGLPGLIPLAGGLAALVLLELRQFRRAILTVAMTAVLLSTVLFGFVAQRISRFQNSERFVQAARKFSGDDFQLASFDIFPSSLVYYSNKTVEHLTEPAQLDDYFARAPKGCLLLTAAAYAAHRDSLPADVTAVDRQQRFLCDEEVVLLARAPADSRRSGGETRAASRAPILKRQTERRFRTPPTKKRAE
ncbi:MAG TPA: glycosyltransferase family 39 protein [Pirellulales bacterium]|jgi:4-amino-4-deoxy-L-arabinose transferase-like glycosyltransferase|nr:glycosyltransferase family 39 protein [Pirellulales bacterium]